MAKRPPPRRRNEKRRKPGWEVRFLRELRDWGNIGRACRRAKIARQSVHQRREEDATFRAAYDEALQVAADGLREEAHRRGVKGIARAVYYHGKRIAHEREYSDMVLLRCLEAHCPEFQRNVNLQIPAIDAAIEELLRKRQPAAAMPLEPTATPTP